MHRNVVKTRNVLWVARCIMDGKAVDGYECEITLSGGRIRTRERDTNG